MLILIYCVLKNPFVTYWSGYCKEHEQIKSQMLFWSEDYQETMESLGLDKCSLNTITDKFLSYNYVGFYFFINEYL